MASIFTKIVNGEMPCTKVAEDDKHLAFMEISPLTQGHTLVIPKKETDYIFDLDNQAYLELMLFAKKTAVALKKAVPCKKVAVMVYGLQVPHAHIHLVPVHGTPGELNLSNAKKSTSEELESIAQKIHSHLR